MATGFLKTSRWVNTTLVALLLGTMSMTERAFGQNGSMTPPTGGTVQPPTGGTVPPSTGGTGGTVPPPTGSPLHCHNIPPQKNDFGACPANHDNYFKGKGLKCKAHTHYEPTSCQFVNELGGTTAPSSGPATIEVHIVCSAVEGGPQEGGPADVVTARTVPCKSIGGDFPDPSGKPKDVDLSTPPKCNDNSGLRCCLGPKTGDPDQKYCAQNPALLDTPQCSNIYTVCADGQNMTLDNNDITAICKSAKSCARPTCKYGSKFENGQYVCNPLPPPSGCSNQLGLPGAAGCPDGVLPVSGQ